MLLPHSTPSSVRQPNLWLAASRGRRLHPAPLAVAQASEAELPMQVQFEGLSEAEQQRALASFPGGRRFVLGGRR